MNKKQYIVILIVAALLLMGIGGVYAETTTASTTATTTSGPKTAGEQGDDDGKAAGENDGAVAGAADRYNGKKSDYKSALPKDAAIIEKYKLNLDVPSYKSHFLSSYRKNFKEGYERAFRDTNLGMANSEDGSEAGNTLGTAAGALAAMNDYILGKKNDANSALKSYLAEKSIENRFNLSKDSKDYSKIFVSSFEAGFKESYNSAYRARMVEFEVGNANTYEISMAGEKVTHVWPIYDVSIGGSSARPNLECSMEIEAGTVYSPTYINVSGEQYSFNYRNYSYVPVSSVFNIKLWGYGSVVLRKPMVMRFNVVGSEKAGIYRWSGYKWQYLPTVVDETGISTVIPAGEYTGGRYAIFIDEKAKPYSDTAFSWARDEINAFKRRGYIEQTEKFRPDESITRFELAKMLYKILYPVKGMNSTALQAVDVKGSSDETDHIRFVLSHAIMKLDNNNKFWPNEGLKYDHVQYLIKNVTGTTVAWSSIAQTILQERFYRSPGIKDKNKTLTRAEAVYLLYHYFDK